MQNVYVEDAHWNAMRDGLAASIIKDEDLDDPVMIEFSMVEAALVMSEVGVCPASLREQIEAEAA